MVGNHHQHPEVTFCHQTHTEAHRTRAGNSRTQPAKLLTWGCHRMKPKEALVKKAPQMVYTPLHNENDDKRFNSSGRQGHPKCLRDDYDCFRTQCISTESTKGASVGFVLIFSFVILSL